MAALRFADAADSMRIGTIARAHGRYAIALSAYEGVRNARIASLGEDDPDTLTSRGNYAAVPRVLGRLHEAECEHRAVLGYGESAPRRHIRTPSGGRPGSSCSTGQLRAARAVIGNAPRPR
ncbi:tetratricopeptide repeat protein [Streptomyces sp. NPDC005727]|uniref:tetratricopeptide repeat protein n=1 Tax=unclassified Streptomyces TaxID=2593676 RepID=UPI00340368D0